MACTVAEFCQKYKISKVTYYALKKRGEGPEELHLGRRRVITDAAEHAWEQRMTKPQSTNELRSDQSA